LQINAFQANCVLSAYASCKLIIILYGTIIHWTVPETGLSIDGSDR
jgi:hypothetical protein